jgi:hypothetical protein
MIRATHPSFARSFAATALAFAFVVLPGAARIALAGDDAEAGPVTIKAWKVDTVDLYEKPAGKIQTRDKPTDDLPIGAAEHAGHGWIKIVVAGKPCFVEASSVRTDLKASGSAECEKFQTASGAAATRGYGGGDCKK